MEKHQNTIITNNNSLVQLGSNEINHNGFSNGPTLAQIIPPILVITCTAISSIQITNSLESYILIIILEAILFLVFLITSILWYLTSKIIPTDSVQILHRSSIEKR